jgi:gamma-glutamyltranspeptidase/glutathione hydrolase
MRQLAFGQRTELGDPAFVEGLIEKQDLWISEESTGKRSKMLSDEHTWPPDYYKPHLYVTLTHSQVSTS